MATEVTAETAQAAAATFFKAPYFAVVGASTKPEKFGHKIFTWYIDHKLPVTPVNPNASSIVVSKKPYPTVPNLSALPHPTETAVSFVTPPEKTIEVLKEAKKLGIPAVWFQPDSFDKEIMEYAQKEFKAAVGGPHESAAHGEWCVLVDGERVAKVAGKHKL